MADMTGSTYAAPSRWLHWITALLVLGLIPAGLVMVNLPDGGAKDGIYELHKSFGVTVFVLAVLRLICRAVYGAPTFPSFMPGWQRFAAGATHALLYVLIVAVPLLGYVGTSMCCAPVVLFGLVPLDTPFGGGMEGAERVLTLHKYAVFTMAGILVLHAGAAAMHGLIWRDGVFQRMWLRRG